MGGEKIYELEDGADEGSDDVEDDKTRGVECIHCSQAVPTVMIPDPGRSLTTAEIMVGMFRREGKVAPMEEGEDKDAPESPFLALRPLLKALQLLGIFNFSFGKRCEWFKCRPKRCPIPHCAFG